jgi:hypothetical protein
MVLRKGTVAEWLGRGLQNLLQRFESARYLRKRVAIAVLFAFTGIPPYSSNAFTRGDERFYHTASLPKLYCCTGIRPG